MQKNASGTLPDICRTAIFNAPIQKVWNAIATSEGLAAWLMPNNFQPILGHEFTLQSQPRKNPVTGEMWDGISQCRVEELNPPFRVGFSWIGNGANFYLTLSLKELPDDKTEFTLIHSGWTEAHAMEHGFMTHGWVAVVEEMLRKLVEA